MRALQVIIMYAYPLALMTLDILGKTFDPNYAFSPIDEGTFADHDRKVAECNQKAGMGEECLEYCKKLPYYRYEPPVKIFESLKGIVKILYEGVSQESYQKLLKESSREKIFEDISDEPIIFFNEVNPIFKRYNLQKINVRFMKNSGVPQLKQYLGKEFTKKAKLWELVVFLFSLIFW